MSFTSVLHGWLGDPRLRGVDFDSDELTEVHRRILSEKPLIRDVMAEFHRLCRDLDVRHFRGPGRRVQLGTGVSAMKALFPDVLCTDIKAAPGLDLQVDAQRMPFAAGTVRAIYAINCFHHFPQPGLFLSELDRVVGTGGGAVIIEPYHGPVARAFYRRAFATEGFDPAAPGWETDVSGVMCGANQALSYIVFERDRARLRREHPSLEVVEQRPLHNYVRYVASGGLNFRQLVPTAGAPLLRLTEALLTPLDRILALHHVIVLRKS